ncbi:MAG: hypothetical protein ABJA61_04915 [Caldimonas sp.]
MQPIQTTVTPSVKHVSTTDLIVVVLSDEELACATGGMTFGPGGGWTDSLVAGPGGGW